MFFEGNGADMTGQEAIYYLKNNTYQGTRLGLERIEELLCLLDNPEKKLPLVHIAGTNGKGSVLAALTSVLVKAGYKTGAFSSPAVSSFNEQITVNLKSISDEALGSVIQRVKDCAEKMTDPPTEFEMVTAAAFEFFVREACDIAVIETGMGGRLDSTNAIPSPIAAVICNIGLDHTSMLGDSLEKIAAEKSGIIKEDCDVILYEPECSEVLKTVKAACEKSNARLHMTDFGSIKKLSDSIKGQRFCYKEHKELEIRLLGEHQLKNAAVVIESVEVLNGKGFKIDGESLRAGLYNTMWQARLEVLSENPVFIADGAHNPQCAEALAAALDNYFPDKKIIFIMGVLGDKDYGSMLKPLLERADAFFTVTVNNPRSLKAETLGEIISSFNRRAVVCQSVEDAVKKAFEYAPKDAVICSAGSLYMMGEVINAVKGYDGAKNNIQ